MKRIFLCFALLAAPLCAIPPSTTTVTFHNTTLGDVATIVFDGKIELAEKQGLSPGYYAINNIANLAFGGTSHIGFTRFRKNATDCDYFFRASTWDSDPFEAGYQAIEVWETVYWAAIMDEPGTLVDGAQWGSDNYVLMLDENEGKLVAVLQFYFDQNDYTATLIGAAVNLDGLTFMEGVLALQAIPEPSTYAAIFGAVALGAVVIVRRRQSKQG